MWYWFFKFAIVRPLVTLGFRSRIEGAERLPRRGGAVLASNHVSAADTIVMPALLKRRVTFPAKAELFAGDRGLASLVIAWFLRAIGQVPLDRSGGRVSMEGLRPVLDVLHAGGLVGIYPEGTRSPDGRLYKGKTGAARMALAAGVPIVPIAMVGSELHKGLFGIPWASRPLVRVGEPLDFSRYHGAQDDRAVVRWVTDEVMAAIMELGGQTYVDAYGTSVKYGGMTADEAARRIQDRPGNGKPAPEPPAVAGSSL